MISLHIHQEAFYRAVSIYSHDSGVLLKLSNELKDNYYENKLKSLYELHKTQSEKIDNSIFPNVIALYFICLCKLMTRIHNNSSVMNIPVIIKSTMSTNCGVTLYKIFSFYMKNELKKQFVLELTCDIYAFIVDQIEADIKFQGLYFNLVLFVSNRMKCLEGDVD